MTDPVLIQPPAAFLTLAEVRMHLRADSDHEDALIEGYMAAATAWLDGWHGVLGRCVLTQTWASTAGALQSMRLPFPDVQSAVVSYLDAAGQPQTVDPATYRVRTVAGAGHLTFAEGFTAPEILAGRDDAVTVTAVYGWQIVPPPLKVAALMLVAHWFRNREAVGTGTITAEVPMAVHALVAPYRVRLF